MYRFSSVHVVYNICSTLSEKKSNSLSFTARRSGDAIRNVILSLGVVYMQEQYRKRLKWLLRSMKVRNSDQD